DSKVLEIGAGSGYQAAIIAEIVTKGRIHSIERISELVDLAQWNLGRAGYKNVQVTYGEGSKGYEEESPYDRIIVTAGAPRIPSALFEQLKEGGKMLIPVGGRTYQELKLVRNKGNKMLVENLGGCMFVPLVGDDGW
ncbi:MAG: protein-L-isoaspartate O-methyltransferase, partial [Candidatus Altiarchaeota archaeon]|nr:protein-L-isoaspartate O-methyltransferase [Candidatus Altiarchaeota archaeon]